MLFKNKIWPEEKEQFIYDEVKSKRVYLVNCGHKIKMLWRASRTGECYPANAEHTWLDTSAAYISDARMWQSTRKILDVLQCVQGAK